VSGHLIYHFDQLRWAFQNMFLPFSKLLQVTAVKTQSKEHPKVINFFPIFNLIPLMEKQWQVIFPLI
jgi:hypothetical protein